MDTAFLINLIKGNSKMAKLITFLAGILLAVSFNANANTDYSKLHTSKGSAAKKTLNNTSSSFSRTEIHICNNSSDVITIRVPGTSLNDILFPGEVEVISSEVYYDLVMIELYDSEGYLFFRGNVANHTSLDVHNPYMTKSVGGLKQHVKPQVTIKAN